MGWMDKVITFVKNGGRAQWSTGRGTSKSWSTEKTWSLKKGDEAKSAEAPAGDSTKR